MKDRKFCCKVFKLYNEFHLSLLEHAVDKTDLKLAVILFESMNRASNKNWDWQNLELGVERKTKNLSFYIKDYLRADYTRLIV